MINNLNNKYIVFECTCINKRFKIISFKFIKSMIFKQNSPDITKV